MRVVRFAVGAKDFIEVRDTIGPTMVSFVELLSNVKNDPPTDEDEQTFNDHIDGLESLLLAMFAEGIILDTPEMHKAVRTAVEAISNHT